MNVDIENLTGRKVEYIGPGSKRGSIGIVEGVGVGPVIFVSFNGFANTRDNRPIPSRYAGCFTYLQSSIEGEGYVGGNKYIKILTNSKVVENKSAFSELGLNMEKQQDHAIDSLSYINKRFKTEYECKFTGEIKMNENTQELELLLANSKPTKFLLVCSADGTPKYKFKATKKGRKKAERVAKGLANKNRDADILNTFYVLEVVSSFQAETVPINKTTFVPASDPTYNNDW